MRSVVYRKPKTRRPDYQHCLQPSFTAARIGTDQYCTNCRSRSTRWFDTIKAGTAQKMVLNMISTAVMIRLGKTYSNLMVDVQPTNVKLRQRARRIVAEATGLDLDQATEVLSACNGEVKTAIVAVLAGISPELARLRLNESGGYVRKAIG